MQFEGWDAENLSKERHRPFLPSVSYVVPSLNETKAESNVHRGSSPTQKDPVIDAEQALNRNVEMHSCSIQGETFTFLQSPDFIIAGAQKAGTTAVTSLLNLHPGIMGSARFEQHYFDQ